MNISKKTKILVSISLSLLLILFSRKYLNLKTPSDLTQTEGILLSLKQDIQSLAGVVYPQKITPSPVFNTPSPTLPPPTVSETSYPTPNKKEPTKKPVIPTKKVSPPTRIPTKKTSLPTPIPTKPPSFSCPSSSGESYNSLPVYNSNLGAGLESSPDVNLYLRGFAENNEGKTLISRNGNWEGYDPIMPPQISSLYGTSIPKIVRTYDIYEWDFDNGRSLAPERASPNYPVHMLGLQAKAGQPLVGLKAGREIGQGNVFLVLYASKNYILFTHSSGDNLSEGYLYYFLDICVDPNLVALYQSDSAQGRSKLPVVATGQTFGYAAENTDVKIVIRDTMSFMDTRYREDWWEYGK
ncbi:MAG: hypothetical protein WC489_00760 [Patescibacteria group bacterium]